MLRVSTSVLNQTGGSIPTAPDDWAVVYLLNHSIFRVEKIFQSKSQFHKQCFFSPSTLQGCQCMY